MIRLSLNLIINRFICEAPILCRNTILTNQKALFQQIFVSSNQHLVLFKFYVLANESSYSHVKCSKQVCADRFEFIFLWPRKQHNNFSLRWNISINSTRITQIHDYDLNYLCAKHSDCCVRIIIIVICFWLFYIYKYTFYLIKLLCEPSFVYIRR